MPACACGLCGGGGPIESLLRDAIDGFSTLSHGLSQLAGAAVLPLVKAWRAREAAAANAAARAAHDKIHLVLTIVAHIGHWREVNACIGLSRDWTNDTAREDGLLHLTMHYAAIDAAKAQVAWAAGAPARLRALRDARYAAFLQGHLAQLAQDGEPDEDVDEAAVRDAHWAEGDAATAESDIRLDVYTRPRRQTRLHRAVLLGMASRVRVLLAAGADVNAHDTWTGETALHRAAVLWRERDPRGSVISSILAAPGCDANAMDDYGNTPLILALRTFWGGASEDRAADLLLRHPGVNANAVEGVDSDDETFFRRVVSGRTPLVLATLIPLPRLVTALLARPEVDPNAADSDGNSSLHHAAAMGNLCIVSTLLAHPQINANAVNSRGHAPLHLAAATGNFRVVVALLVHPRITAHVLDSRGRAPLWYAAHNGHVSIVAALIAAPSAAAGINHRDEEEEWHAWFARTIPLPWNRTPREHASHVDRALANHVDLARDMGGRTALRAARDRSKTFVAALLAAAGGIE